MGSKWRLKQNGDKMATKCDKMAIKWRKNGKKKMAIKWGKKWRQNGVKMATKWR